MSPGGFTLGATISVLEHLGPQSRTRLRTGTQTCFVCLFVQLTVQLG